MTSPLSGLISEVRGTSPGGSSQGGISDMLREVRGGGSQPVGSALSDTPAEASPTMQNIAAAEGMNVAENIQKLRGLLGRPDISPQQRSRVQAMISRLEGPTVAGFSVGNRVEDTNRSGANNFFRGAGAGVVNYGLIGAADLVGAAAQIALPKGIERLLAIPQWREQMHEAQAIVKDAFDPEGYAGGTGTVVGALAGGAIGPTASGAQGARGAFGYLNAAGAKALARIPVVGPRMAGVVLRGLEPGATYLERVAAQALGSGAVDAVQVADVLSEPNMTNRERAAAIIATVGLSGSVAALSALRSIKPSIAEVRAEANRAEAPAAPGSRAAQADELITQGQAVATEKASQRKNQDRMRRAARVEWESQNRETEWESLSQKERRAVYTEYNIRRDTNSYTSQEPEQITAAAIRTPDGRIAQGPNHGDAVVAMYGEGYLADLTGSALEESKAIFSQIEDGFMTNKGRFVTREEAAQIMTKFNDHTITADEMHSNVTDATQYAERKIVTPSEREAAIAAAKAETQPSITGDTQHPAARVSAPDGERPAGAPSRSPEIESDIARLESEVMRERERRVVAERERDTDLVTGYGNKNAWMRARAAIDADPNLEVTIFDITNFKAWNDTYGFDVGDELLRDHGHSIAAAMGKHDQPARIFTNAEGGAAGTLARQGDEFMIAHGVGKGPEIIKAAQELAGKTSVGPYEVRLRAATGETFSEATMNLKEVKAAETHVKARPGTDVNAPKAETVKLEGGKPVVDPYADATAHQTPLDPSLQFETRKVVNKSNEAPRMDNAEYNRLYRTQPSKLSNQELEALRQEIGRRSAGYDTATMKDTGYDKRISELDELIASRGTGEKDGVTFYSHPGVTGAVIGFASGMALPADDDQERFRNALYLAGVGAFGGTAALRAIRQSMNKSVPEWQARVRNLVRSVEDAPLEKRTSVMTKLSRFYQDVARRDLPISQIVRLAGQRDLPAGQNPGKMFELVGLWKGGADRWMLGDRVGYYTNDGQFIKLDAMTLQQIAAIVNSDVRTVGDLAAARLELTLRARGKSTGMSAEDARQMFVNTPEKYHEAAEQLSKYFRSLADMSVAADLLSPETRAKFDEQPFYVAIRRLFNDEPGSSSATIDSKAHTNGGLITTEQMFKKLKGGDQPFQNPFEAAIDLTPRYMRAAELNRNMKLLFDLVEGMPVEQRKLFAKRLTRVETDKLPENAQVEAGARLLQADMQKHGTQINPDEARSIVRMLSEESLNITDDKVRFYRGGQAEVWQVSEPIAKALKSMTPSELQGVIGAVVGFAEKPAQFARIGITANPVFILWQAFRDVWQFHMNGTYGLQTEARRVGETRAQFVARSAAGAPAALIQGPASLAGSAFYSIRAWAEMMFHTGEYKNYVQAGAGGESVASQGLQLVRGNVRESTDIIRKIQETPVRNQFEQIAREAKQLNLRGLREAYASIMQPIADAGRFGAYLKERGRGVDVIEAVYRSKKAGANFSNRGAAPAILAMNRITLFLNPSIQSMDATKYAFQKDPAGWVARGVAGIMIPSMMLWFAYDDDQEIREVRNTPYGSKYWWFRVNGELMRVPKPIFDGQVFGTTIESYLESTRRKDPLAYQRLGESVINDASLNLLPTIGVVPISLMTNKVYGLGSAIVPERKSGLDIEHQAGPETSTLSRMVSRAIAPSVRNTESEALRTAATPAGIDFMIAQIGGTGRAELARALSIAIDLQNGAEMPPKEELPFVRSAFSKYPGGSTASINEFYTFAERADRATRTADYLLQTNPERFGDYMLDRQDEIMLASTYAQARQTITEYRKAIEDVRQAPRDVFSDSEKRDMIAEYQRLIIEIAKTTNDVRRSVLEGMVEQPQR